MASRLKALRKEEDLAAIPVDQPVLVELEPAATALIAEDDAGHEGAAPVDKARESEGDDGGVKIIKEQMVAMQKAADIENARLREESRKATERAAEAERQAREARSEKGDAEVGAVEAGLAAAQRERDAASLEVERAFEAADGKALAKAQERLGRAAADIRDYEKSAAVLADRKVQEERQAREQPQRSTGPVDVVAGIDANPNLMPVEKEWLKAHQDAVIDASRNQELGVAYTHATRAGHIRGTDSYFKFIEQFMGYSKAAPHTVDDADDERTAIVAAPVSRDNRSNANGRQSGNRILISPEAREIGRSMGLSDVEIAQGIVKMEADKKANPEKYFRN